MAEPGFFAADVCESDKFLEYQIHAVCHIPGQDISLLGRFLSRYFLS